MTQLAIAPRLIEIWCDHCCRRSLVSLREGAVQITCAYCTKPSLIVWCLKCEAHAGLARWDDQWMCPTCKVERPIQLYVPVRRSAQRPSNQKGSAFGAIIFLLLFMMVVWWGTVQQNQLSTPVEVIPLTVEQSNASER